jgi:LacI family gluconate utilization system Gnt-I transcriptional repressor
MKEDSLISVETRSRILKVVREMNYVPNQVAGSLTTKRSGFVGVLVPSLNNLHFAETVQTLTEVIEGTGRQILLGHSDYSAEREERIVELMLRRRPEAIILSYDGHADRTVQFLHDARIPVIELWERPARPIAHTVGFSNRAAAAEMTEALIGKGYRRIAFLGEADDDWTRGAARRAGFILAMERSGLSAHRQMRVGKPPISIEVGAAAIATLLERYPDTDCVFCVSDAPAFGALSALVSLGRRVPEDIGIVGFGNFEVSRFSTPAISTVMVDPRWIGRVAGQLVTELLAEPADAVIEPRQIPVETRPCFRGSTR